MRRRRISPREFPDFMERWDKPMYTSEGALGKLYPANIAANISRKSSFVFSANAVEDAYDHDLINDGCEGFLETAASHKETYKEKISALLNYYGAESEDELLTGNIRNKSMYLQRDNRRYTELKDFILISIKSLQKEARGWFENSCEEGEQRNMASAWYHVTYHPTYSRGSANS